KIGRNVLFPILLLHRLRRPFEPRCVIVPRITSRWGILRRGQARSIRSGKRPKIIVEAVVLFHDDHHMLNRILWLHLGPPPGLPDDPRLFLCLIVLLRPRLTCHLPITTLRTRGDGTTRRPLTPVRQPHRHLEPPVVGRPLRVTDTLSLTSPSQ